MFNLFLAMNDGYPQPQSLCIRTGPKQTARVAKSRVKFVSIQCKSWKFQQKASNDVRYVSKYHDTPGVSGYDTAKLVH